MIYFGVIVFFMAAVHPPLIRAEKTWAHNTLLYGLNVDPRDVAAFDVVTIILPKQSNESMKINGMSMTIRGSVNTFKLNLYPRDSMLVSNKTPVYLVNRNANKSGGVEYVLQENAMNKVGQLLEDRFHRASVILGTDENNERTIMAAIGGVSSTSGMIIKSFPRAVIEENLRKRRSIGENSIDDEDEDDYGGSYKDDDNDSISIRAIAVNLEYMKGHKHVEDVVRGKRAVHEGAEIYRVYNGTARAKPRSPAALYPKILLAADSFYYIIQSPPSLVEPLEYLVVFFNTIDLYFRHLEDPIVKLHIAAITIATSPSATPYIEKSVFPTNKRLHATSAIDAMSTYFYDVKNQIPVKYDIALSLTQFKITRHTKGVSRHGGACRFSSGRMNGVVLIHDNGVFSEIETAVHELGHSLGLPDDPKEEQLNDCFKPLCLKSSAYIMAPLSLEQREPTFSLHSLDVLDQLVENGTLSCMYEKPVKDSITLPESSPPKVPSLTEQCQAHGKVGPCPGYEDNMCTRLRCVEPSIAFKNETIELCVAFYHPAVPGTPCKIEGHPHPAYCYHNHCVSM